MTMWVQMEIENYRESILPDLAELGQEAFPLHDISVGSMRRITVGDPNFLPEDLIVAREGGDILGAALGARYRKQPEGRSQDPNGYIKMICSSPFDAELMRRILSEVEVGLKDEGAEAVSYSNFASWHLFPGVDLRYEDLLDFLLSEGFSKSGECVDYLIDLSAFRIPRRVKRIEEEVLGSAIRLRLAEEEDREGLREWISERSGFAWSYEAARAVGRAGSGVWLAEDGDELIGFSVFGSLEHHWFGPIAVEDERRRKGLGSVLMFRTIQSMKELGVSRAVIPWTRHLLFYSQIPGIVGLRHYWTMSKGL